MQCAILAGGLATRMLPATSSVPKALLDVAGRPFAHWQLTWLAAEGVTEVVYCVAHLGDQIRDYVGDGARWGLAVNYADEGQHRLGTAGALANAARAGLLDESFLTLYGDSYLQVPIADVWRAFLRSTQPALMTVYRNELYEASNVLYCAGQVLTYRKPASAAVAADAPTALQHIDYGLLAFNRDLIEREVPAGEPADLSVLQASLAAQGLLAGYEVGRRYYEIGSPDGRVQLERFLQTTSPRRHAGSTPRASNRNRSSGP